MPKRKNTSMLLKAILILHFVGVIREIESCEVSVRYCHPCRGSVTTGLSDVTVTGENSELITNLMKELARIRLSVITYIRRIILHDFGGNASTADGFTVNRLPFVRNYHRLITTSNLTRIYDILSDIVLNLRVHSVPYPRDNGLDYDWMEPGNAISSAFCYLKKLAQSENVHIPRQICRKSLSVDTQPPNHLTFSIWMYAILRDARQQLTQIMDIFLTNSFS